MIFKWVMSLFTTGGKVNPLAVVLLVVSGLGVVWTYHEFRILQTELKAARQTRIIQDDAKEKLETLREAESDKDEVEEAIRTDSFNNDLLRRLQSED